MRAAPWLRFEADRVIEHARDALDDRQPEPKPARHLGTLIEAVKFVEDRALLRLWNPKPGVVDVEAQLAAVQPATDQDASLRRVLDRVRDQILQKPPQEPPVGTYRARAGDELEPQPIAARQRGEFDFELTHQFVQPERR